MNTNNATTPEIVYRGFALGPFETNCYVVRAVGSEGCWIVDAGFEPGELIGYVRQEGLTPEALVLTHAHADHIAGVREVVEAFPGTPVWIHEAEGAWLGDPQLNLSAAMGMGITAPGPDRLLEEGQELTLDGSCWRVLHTPGHSPGGITLSCESAGLALVGDALFAGSIGRTDFPGCSFETLEASIRDRLYPLPEETRCLPGHGPETTIGREKASNPFVRPV
ncbi:MBL-fold metallo-hydrolase superfamily [hydrothermal vent metagenome]|uniref:MBL-fold metallo-hydrolase superfamily n=1 Tax=hydrothermal vent metagenome TaxID=652676 RepID=A0A3B1DLN0_9ZZZZ